MEGCTLKGNPATFYNPVQNNMGENLQVFIEQMYNQNKPEGIDAKKSVSKS
jgi:hypothetical protein